MSTGDERLADILEGVAADIRAVLSDDWVNEVDISMSSSFADDLEIESVEMVALSELLEARYGESIELAAWLAELEMDELVTLEVGDLVRHIALARKS